MKALLVGVGLAFVAMVAAAPAQAEPPPGCLYQAVNWYDPCSGVSPWTQQNGSNWSPVDGVPGMYGPNGYTPVTQQPVPGRCTDFRAACPSSWRLGKEQVMGNRRPPGDGCCGRSPPALTAVTDGQVTSYRATASDEILGSR